MKGLFTPLAFISLFALSGCDLTDAEKEKLENAAIDLEKLADQIIITSPANDAVISQSMVTVRADIPADAQATEVILYVDGIEIAKDTDGAPWEMQWPAYYWGDGNKHTLLLKTITGSGNEVRNNGQFQVTVTAEANQALTFTAGIDGTQIQEQNQFEVAFTGVPSATRYEVTDSNQIIETTTPSTTLNNLDVGSYTVRYRALFDYSSSTTLTGPWSAPAQLEVLSPQLPVIHEPNVVKNEQGYDVKFSWDALSDNDIYSISITKSGQAKGQIVLANANNELVLPGMEMGTYTWSLIRKNSLNQEAHSEPQKVEAGVFKRQFGGSANDYAKHVISSRDGGFIILGSTRSKGDANGDDWFIKLDANGHTEWEHVLEKSGSARLSDLREFPDGSIFAYGSNDNWQDAKGYIVKLSGSATPQNRLLWEVEYREASADKEYFSSLTENASRLFVSSQENTCDTAGGTTTCQISKLKLVEFNTESGEYVSSFELPAPPDDYVQDSLGYLSTTSDGDFLLAGSATPQNPPEIYYGGAYLMKLDLTGNLSWSQSYLDNDIFMDGQFGKETPWGEFILLGHTLDAGAALAKVSSSGSKIGTYAVGINTYSNPKRTTVFDDDENMLMLFSSYTGGWPELWSTSRSGLSHKIKVFDGLKYDYSSPQSLDRALDGGLVLLFNESQSGYNNSDIIVMKTDINGNM